MHATLLMYSATMKYLMYFVALCAVALAESNQLDLHKYSRDLNSTENDDALPAPDGLFFVGSGYNLVKGNPDGHNLANGGVDPGLLPASRMLQLTYKENRKSENLKYVVPDQINFAPRDSCMEEKTHDIIISAKSYQKQLEVSVSAEASYEAAVWSAAFTASAGYKKINKDTSSSQKVFIEERKVCLKGNVRYRWSQRTFGTFSVTKEFAAAICALPKSYDKQKYRQFIDVWGTDVVVEAQLGTKTVRRFQSSTSEFTEYAMNNVDGSVSASVNVGGFGATVSVNVQTMAESLKSGSTFGSSETTLKSGGDNLPEPISIKLMSIINLFDHQLFKAYKNKEGCSYTEETLAKLRVNVQMILNEYPNLLAVKLPEDKKIVFPVTWPRGTYALPMPKDGCPRDDDFTWHRGFVYQDTKSRNDWPKYNHLDINTPDKNAQQKFCVKTATPSKHNYAWPKGSYCIAKKGDCPTGFKSGQVTWHDNKYKNADSSGGALPDVTFGKDSTVTLSYCCRDDGFPSNEIYLPNDKPFLLYKRKVGKCQQVSGMRSVEEFFKWDVVSSSSDIVEGDYPYGIYTHDIQIFYCYYIPVIDLKTEEILKKLFGSAFGFPMELPLWNIN